MRTTPYSRILAGSAALAGKVYEAGSANSDLTAGEFAQFRTWHDRRLGLAWRAHRWPELCAVAEFHFAPTWRAADWWMAGNFVYHAGSQQYFQALIDSQGEPPASLVFGDWVTDLHFWSDAGTPSGDDWTAETVPVLGGVYRNPETGGYVQCYDAVTPAYAKVNPFIKTVALEGEVLLAWSGDPRKSSKISPLPFVLGPEGAQFQTTLRSAWIEYRQPRPKLAGGLWDTDTTYAAGQGCYWVAAGVGNFYVATAATAAGESPGSAPSKWAAVEIPQIFGDYLAAGGYADWLTADGQADKAAAAETGAGLWLELEADVLQRQQGQVRRMSYR